MITISEIKAAYISNKKIFVGEQIPIQNIKITVTKDDGSVVNFTLDQKPEEFINDFQLSKKRVVKVGENPITLSYIDAIYEHGELVYNNLLECKFYVQGMDYPYYLTSFKAKYTGNKITVDEPIPKKNINIYTELTNGNTQIERTQSLIEHPEYILEPIIMPTAYENEFIITYHEIVYDDNGDFYQEADWSDKIIIQGKVKELDLQAEYDGEAVQLNTLIPSDWFKVYLTYYDGFIQDTRLLDYNEWSMTTIPQKVTDVNNGIFTITRGSLSCQVQVPFFWDAQATGFKLEAWYEGAPVKINTPFVPNDFRIFLHTPEGLIKRLEFNECSIDPTDYTIKQDWYRNWFTLTHKAKYDKGTITVQDRVVVWGIEDKERPVKEFKIEWYNEKEKQFEDVTELFEDATLIAGRRFVNWERISKCVAEIGKFGYYILQAPAQTGLNGRYPTIWEFECNKKDFYEKTKSLRAELIKVFYSEEE